MSVLVMAMIIVLDQITKLIVKAKLMPMSNIDIINGFFSLSYVENRGAAFGLFKDNKILLIGCTAIVTAFILYYIYKYKNINKFYRISLILIGAGAIGNLIDRIFLGYVVDFLHLYITTVFDWPVFNIADMSVVFGTAMLIFSLIFIKETDEHKTESK